jgi:hypothetical protein
MRVLYFLGFLILSILVPIGLAQADANDLPDAEIQAHSD